jgi:hypothetical protein
VTAMISTCIIASSRPTEVLNGMRADGIVKPGPWFGNDRSLEYAGFRKGYGNPEIFKHHGKLFHSGLRLN